MQNTRVRRVGALLLGLAIVGAACGDDDEESTTTTAESSSETTTAPATTSGGTATTTGASGGGGAATPTGVTCDATSIGYFGPLTGDAANLGINIQRGAKLAIDQFNEANPDCQVTLVDFDSQGSPDRAPDLAKQAIDNAEVIGIVGPAFSGESAATGDAFAEAGLATITPSATNPTLADNDWPTWNRLLGNDALQGPGVAAYIRDTAQATQVFVVDDASEYGKGLADIVREDLGDLVIGSDQVQAGQTDFASVVSAVESAGADTVFFGGYYAEAGLFAKQLREGGFSGTFVSGDGSKDVGFVEAAGAANAEGAVLTCTCAPPEQSPEFLAAYQAANGGEEPQTYGAEAYDAANVFLNGLAEGATEREAMVEFARNYEGEGVTKDIAFDDTGEIAGGAVYAFIVEGGRIVGQGIIGE